MAVHSINRGIDPPLVRALKPRVKTAARGAARTRAMVTRVNAIGSRP